MNNLINFKKLKTYDETLKNNESEYIVYEQLQTVIDSYEYSMDEHDSDSETEDPMDSISEEYLDLCEQFFVYLSENKINVMSEKKIHNLLNENPELKKGMFKEEIDTTVFQQDTNESVYKQEEAENQEITKQKNEYKEN